MVLQRYTDTVPQLVLFGLTGGLLLVGVAALVCPRNPGRTVMAIAMLVAHPVLPVALFLFSAIVWPLGPALTRMAGNPPVNGADTDLVITPLGVLVGLVLGALLVAAARVRWPTAPRAEEPAPVVRAPRTGG